MLPDGLEWAAPGLHPDEWCIRRTGADVMLCRRALDGHKRESGFVPVIQPAAIPDGAHQRCLDLLAGLHGLCPACGGDIALDNKWIAAHGMWKRTRDGAEPSDQPCPGAGQLPEETS